MLVAMKGLRLVAALTLVLAALPVLGCRVPCPESLPRPLRAMCEDRRPSFDECYDRCRGAGLPDSECFPRCMPGEH